MNTNLEISDVTYSKISGSSPAEDRYYVLVVFDISDSKKYRLLIKTLNRYSTRIQKSVFEAQLTRKQIKDLMTSVEQLMLSEKYYHQADNVRIYRIAGNCSVTIYGTNESVIYEDNIFL